MWVKNQDGIAVVNVDALALDPAEFNKENNKNGIRIWGSISDHDYIMGVYHNIGDAQMVLGDFVQAIERKVVVFEMPKAEDVPPKEVQ